MISVGLVGRPIDHRWQKLDCYNFLGPYKYDKCQTLHDGSTH